MGLDQDNGLLPSDLTAEHWAMMELHVCTREGEMLRAFAIGDNAELIIGRDESCDIQIRAQTVSREHCSIEFIGEEMMLRDLKSSGGTYLNGERVDNVRIEDGMEVSVGPAVLKFLDAEF